VRRRTELSYAKFRNRVFVQIDSQPWFLGHIQITVFRSDYLLGQHIPQVRIILRREFNDECVRYRVQPMQGRRHIDVGSKSVVRLQDDRG
jgi:hypothetical protein